MKTSKIIFISLLGAIALLILATMIDIRVSGQRNSDIHKDFKVTRKGLPSFKVLYMNNCMNAELVQNDSSFIEVTCHKDSIVPKVNYTVNDDTLLISDFETPIHRNVSIRIHSTDSLKKILMKNSDISIMRLGYGKLSLDLDKSSVWMDRDKDDKYRLPMLDVIAKNHSIFNTGNFRVDSLGIILQNSRANIRISAKKINGSLADSSRIDARQPEEIALKKDKTSKINVDDY